MKKILFASTALVASAGIAAAAEVDFSGAAGMGFGYDGSDWSAISFATLSVAMTGETDGGLSFGADFDITAGNGFDPDKAEDRQGIIDDAVVYIEGGFGKFSIGDVDNAVQVVTGLGDLGFDGLGVDDLAEGLRGLSSANTLYEGTFGDFTGAISYDLGGTEDVAVGVKYAMGDYSIALGYGTYQAATASGQDAVFTDRQNALSVQLGADIGDVSLAALYSQSSWSGAVALTDSAGVVTNVADSDGAKARQLGVTAGYTMGAVTVTAAYTEARITGAGALNGKTEAYGLGVSYDLGGGATLDGGVAEVGGTTVADLGINMSF
ncbi:porin [Aliiroseovarius sp. 2305UL8-7]|uniref:porin n=1 Tax=Aliiroseovarius conchicola TaxID=3121637 RepID=UPI0035271141